MLSCAWPFFIGMKFLEMHDYIALEFHLGAGWASAFRFVATLGVMNIVPIIAYEQIRYWMSKGEHQNRGSTSNSPNKEK